MEFSKEKLNVLAFYLPQYHAIPENDKAYGKGFTEWTNVKKSTPLFEGHRQLRVPLNNNYYDLLDGKTLKNQAELAKSYGVSGFCYYHYYFGGGKKLLEKPLEAMLKDKSIDMPFCICWANENWTRRWDGGNNEVIAEQHYDRFDEIDEHARYLAEFFKDERYITLEGKPFFVLYRPGLIPHVAKYIKEMRRCFAKYGFPEVVIAVQQPFYYLKRRKLNLFDYYIQYEPSFTIASEFTKPDRLKDTVKAIARKLHLGKIFENRINKQYQEKSLTIRDYDEDWQTILSRKINDKRLLAGGFVDFDNSPRLKKGMVYKGNTPEKFDKYFGELCEKTKNEFSLPIIFLMAWNEWGEGAYLEGDTDYGLSYLESIKKYVAKN